MPHTESVQRFVQKIGPFYEYINDDKANKDAKKDEDEEIEVVQEEEEAHVHTNQLFNEIINGVKSTMELKLNGHSKEFDFVKKPMNGTFNGNGHDSFQSGHSSFFNF